jgi:hypothetical protein
MSLIEHWPTASCCGEPRVTRHVDRCYDHAKVCATCDEPSEDGVCPACQLAGAVEAQIRRIRIFALTGISTGEYKEALAAIIEITGQELG